MPENPQSFARCGDLWLTRLRDKCDPSVPGLTHPRIWVLAVLPHVRQARLRSTCTCLSFSQCCLICRLNTSQRGRMHTSTGLWIFMLDRMHHMKLAQQYIWLMHDVIISERLIIMVLLSYLIDQLRSVQLACALKKRQDRQLSCSQDSQVEARVQHKCVLRYDFYDFLYKTPAD